MKVQIDMSAQEWCAFLQLIDNVQLSHIQECVGRSNLDRCLDAIIKVRTPVCTALALQPADEVNHG